MPFSWLGVIIASTCLIGILYGSIIGKTKFDVKDITFRSPNIPQSFNGYKIIQLSDIHMEAGLIMKKSWKEPFN